MTRWWVCVALGFLLVGCREDMVQQRRLDANAATDAWVSGAVARPAPPGSIATDAIDPATALNPPPLDAALLARGQERFTIFCAPCHGSTGQGDGIIVRRGFPRPPSYELARLRAAPARHFYDVISEGHGVMVGFADRIAPADRWAITAYIRALQRAGHVEVAAMPELREHLP